MTTLKARIITSMIRNRHLLQGKLTKPVFGPGTSIPAFRELCEKGAARYARIPAGVEVRPAMVAGMKAEWYVPAGAAGEKMILYVHGGGYVSGSCSDHRGFVSRFASFTGMKCLLFEYRLAPEFPFPAALDDAVAAWRWLQAEGFSAANIIIAGESAGGGLTLAMLLALRDRGLELPRAAVAISPWTDLTCSQPSYRTKNSVSVAPMNSWHLFSSLYTGENSADNPYISPLFGDLHGLPPVFINAGTNDELFDDGEQFYLKACKAGVDARFRAGEGMIHCYPMLAPMFREATQAMEEIVDFTREMSR